MINISIAGLNITLKNRYSFVERIAKDYINDFEAAHFSVEATDTEIAEERDKSDYSFDNGYLESIVLYRNIAERLPEYDAFVFHGAVIACEGRAYAVTARSGVGKTTHLRLWLREFGDSVHILNGDKPILRVIDGKVYACATPWRGKEGYGVNEMLPLCGIAFLERSDTNSASLVSASEGLVRFASQIYIPKDPRTAPLALACANKILSRVPLHTIRANMEPEAARVARAAFCSTLI